MNNHILLSIAVLVSNRRDTIRPCLDSLTPIREAIPCELILLDTGCDADVRAILEEYGDTVAEFTWCQDFSKARNATLPYAVRLANKGWRQACREDAALAQGVNMVDGKVTFPAVAEAWGLEYTKLEL